MREAAGLTQEEVCARTGIARPNLSAYENGRRLASSETVERIRAACRLRPSAALARHEAEVVEIIMSHRGVAAEVFGSVARGEDRWDSDLDLMVTVDASAGYLDLVRMKAALEAALNIPVDVVSRASVTRDAESALSAAILRAAKPIEAVRVP